MKWIDHREPWTKGGPEWVVRHALGSLASPYVANPQLSLYVGADQRYSMRRSNNPQTTTDANIYLTDMQLWRWNLLNQTKEAYLYVYEDDGGLKSVSLPLPVLKGTFGIKDVFGATVNTELTVGGGNVTWLVGDDQVGGVVLYYENNWQDHDDLQARTYGYPIIVGGNITMYCKERSW